MKATIKKNSTVFVEIEYPRLMVCKEDLDDSNHSKNPLIVLFANQNQGIVISGHNADDFRSEEADGNFEWGYSDYTFIPFIGEITLTSESR